MRFLSLSLISAALGLASLVSAGGSAATCKYDGGKLTGCPANTVYVKSRDMAALRGAISSKSVHAVLIGAGTYIGQLVIDEPKILMGEGSVTLQSSGVRVFSAGGDKSNADFATVNIKAKGKVYLHNIVIENLGDDGRGKGPKGPSLAVNIGDKASVGMYECTLKSWQDTINISGSLYMKGGAIYGWVDQIYGEGRAFFQSVDFKIRGCGGAIMAPRGASGGIFVANACAITRASDARANAKNCYLCRPWDSQAHAVYINCKEEPGLVAPEGWTVWDPSDQRISPQTFFREYPASSSTAKRNKLGGILTESQVALYSNPKKIVPGISTDELDV